MSCVVLVDLCKHKLQHQLHVIRTALTRVILRTPATATTSYSAAAITIHMFAHIHTGFRSYKTTASTSNSTFKVTQL
jgi:hypothetical protein